MPEYVAFSVKEFFYCNQKKISDNWYYKSNQQIKIIKYIPTNFISKIKGSEFEYEKKTPLYQGIFNK